MPKCNRCGDAINTIPELKGKIKNCDKKKCKCKTAKFQAECAYAFECTSTDFLSVSVTELIFYPKKTYPIVQPPYSNHSFPQPPRPRYGGSWVCINDPLKDCSCGNMTHTCQHHIYGYD